VASLLGFLAYPFLIEPNVTLRQQSLGWSGAYGIFVLFGAVAAFAGSRTDAPQACTGSDAGDANAGYRPPRMQEQLFWMLLAACSSTMLDTLTCQ